jgi:Fe-S-cluster-containing dehydrogenase component
MTLDRRSLLTGAAATAAAAAASTVSRPAEAAVKTAPADAVGLLYDTTLCIGCKTCVVACREANDKKPDTSNSNGLWDAPLDLNGQTKNIIKLYKDPDSPQRSYFKAQCMHCIDPACVGACMIGALQKREMGIVTYKQEYCSGCRYCQVACPFEIPKFEWSSKAPLMVKCELCNHRLAEGKLPGCVEVCPRQAVIYGKRDVLLADAKKRIADHPDRYRGYKDGDPPRVFGETEGGGTQCLVLSHLPQEKLGLPALEETSQANATRAIQHGVYQGFVAPLALYAVLGAVVFRNKKAQDKDGKDGGAA